MTAMDAPGDLLACHPETAYFWGHVAGDGTVSDDEVVVTTTDEACAKRLAAIAGGGTVEHAERERPYAHDTSITRTEDEYTVAVAGATGARAGAAFGLPMGDSTGGYRFDALADARRQLVRGLLESCGTVCFKSSTGTVGISFVHDDRALLETVEGLLADADVHVPLGEVQATSSGGYWVGVDDDAAGRFGEWVYEGSADSDLYAPSRRRKLRRSLAEAADP